MKAKNANHEFRLGNMCIDRFAYMRLYGDYHASLFGLSDNGWRVLRALVLCTDVDDGFVHVYVKPVKMRIKGIAFMRVLDTDYNIERRYYRGCRELIDLGVLRKVISSFGWCYFVNPMVVYMADYRNRKGLIEKWVKEFGKAEESSI